MIKGRPKSQNDFVVPAFAITHVWHLTHVNNLASIFNNSTGLLSKNALQQQHVDYQDISMREVQCHRAIRTINGIPLHSYVPTYVVQRNPMMYFLQQKADHLVWLKIAVSLLPEQDCLTADRNAAAFKSQFFQGIQSDRLAWHVLTSPTWHDYPEGKSLRCAEILVLNRIPLTAIAGAEVCNPNLISFIEHEYGLETTYAADRFFRKF